MRSGVIICMSTVSKIIKNTTSMVLADIITKLFAIIVIIYLARYLGVEDFGKYNFITTYFSFFMVLATFGLDPVVIKEIAKDKTITDKIINNVLIVRLLTSFVSIILSIIAIKVLNYSGEIVFYVALGSCTMIFQSLSYVYESLFQAYLKMQYYAVSVVLYKLIFSIFVFLIIFAKGNVFHAILALVLSEFLRTIIDLNFSRKFLKYEYFDFSINLSYWKSLIKQALPFIMSAAFFIVYYRIDVLMISSMKGDVSVGLYSAAYKLTDPLLFLPAALSSTLMPVMSKQYIGEDNAWKRTYIISMRYIFILMAPITMGIYALSEKIILLLYGTEYSGSAVALQILIWSLLFNSLNSIQASMLISIDKQKVNSLITGLGCIINIILNFILIPRYDYIGAAAATLLSVMVVFASGYYLVSKNISVSKRLIFSKPSIATLVMGIIVLKLIEYNIVYLIIIGAFVYFSLMIILKGYKEEDIKLFKKIINRS